MPVWLAWIKFISPFYWAITAIANSEFHAPAYAAPVAGPGSASLGQTYMGTFG